MLEEGENYYRSADTGLIFPNVNGIPVLKKEYGILATALID
jgi:hypothetical protein